MTLTLAERALLAKLFYRNGDSAIVALLIFRSLKGFKKDLLTLRDYETLRYLIMKFEAMG